MNNRWGFRYIASACVLSCAARVGTAPHDASAEQHAAAAEQAEAQVRLLQLGAASREDCVGSCWAEAIDAHNDRKRYRRLAEQHREAQAVLLQAEAESCAGVSPDDRNNSPFHRLDVISVKPLRAKNDGSNARILGAVVVFRAVPRLTLDGLQRSVDCHIARAGVIGHDAPELRTCPLAPRGVQARTYMTGSGFTLEIRADEQDSAEEVWQRAKSFLP